MEVYSFQTVRINPLIGLGLFPPLPESITIRKVRVESLRLLDYFLKDETLTLPFRTARARLVGNGQRCPELSSYCG